jgi:hypothetical protein
VELTTTGSVDSEKLQEDLNSKVVKSLNRCLGSLFLNKQTSEQANKRTSEQANKRTSELNFLIFFLNQIKDRLKVSRKKRPDVKILLVQAAAFVRLRIFMLGKAGISPSQIKDSRTLLGDSVDLIRFLARERLVS